MESVKHFSCNALCNKKAKFILSSISTLFFNINAMFCFVLAQFSPYITSYLHYQKVNIDMHFGNLMMPTIIFSLSLSIPIGAILENKLGMRATLLISFTLIEIFLFLFINQTNKIFTFILIVLLGMSVGIGMVVPGKNLCFYYPERKGLIGSCIQSVMILIAAFITVFGEKFINPEKYVLKKEENYYPLEISINYIGFYKIILFIIPVTSFLSIFLIQKYDSTLEKNSLIKKQNHENEKIEKKNDNNYSKNIKAALLNNRIWKITLMSTFIPFSIKFANSTFRVYGALNSINGTIMQYSSLFGALSSVFFGPIWGIINDKCNFNILIKILSICAIIYTVILSFFIQYNLIYIICIFAGSIITCGLTTIFQPHIMKIYGMKYCLIVGGIAGIMGSIFDVLSAVLSFVVSKFYKTGIELQFSYRFIYIVGIGLSTFGFYLGLKENDDAFVYPFDIKEENFQNLGNVNTDEELYNNKYQDKKKKGGDIEVELEMENYKDVTLS